LSRHEKLNKKTLKNITFLIIASLPFEIQLKNWIKGLANCLKKTKKLKKKKTIVDHTDYIFASLQKNWVKGLPVLN